jgi:hypothetical protein
MIRSFLSHSSQDKRSYVEIVARKLGYHNCVYDEYTFEEGMRSLDEILKNISTSSLFVLFISDSALKSEWVKREILEAEELSKSGKIKRIFPIIIDKNINHQDKRIPSWMREYNLKYVSKPVIAARRINQRLKELSWELHPRLKEKNAIFVGRNKLINSFEERIDDFGKPKPICVIASGIKEIGRRSLLRRCYIKSNLILESYESSSINLTSQESLEDFIVKINDLGFSQSYDLTNFMTKSVDEKVLIAIDIVTDVQKANEIITIVDNGCIVNNGEISGWFIGILEGVKRAEKITFSIASTSRLKNILCVMIIEYIA